MPSPGIPTNSTQATAGCTSQRQLRVSRGEAKSRPAGVRNSRLGNPCNRGKRGAPSQMSGGATIISNRCWTMCACSNCAPSAYNGDARATAVAVSPPRKAARRPGPKRSGTCACSRSHPVRYTPVTRANGTATHGSSVQDSMRGCVTPCATAPGCDIVMTPQRPDAGEMAERAGGCCGGRNVCMKATRAVTSAGVSFLP
jgi:hypothetical protein